MSDLEWIEERAECNLNSTLHDLYQAAKEAVDAVNKLPVEKRLHSTFEVDWPENPNAKDSFAVVRIGGVLGLPTEVRFENTLEAIQISRGEASWEVTLWWNRRLQDCRLILKDSEDEDIAAPDLIEMVLGPFFFGN